MQKHATFALMVYFHECAIRSHDVKGPAECPLPPIPMAPTSSCQAPANEKTERKAPSHPLSTAPGGEEEGEGGEGTHPIHTTRSATSLQPLQCCVLYHCEGISGPFSALSNCRPQ